MSDEELVENLKHIQSEIKQLQLSLHELQTRTNLISPSFMTRAFAVLGHYFVAGLIIAVPFYVLFFIIALIAGALG